MFKLCGRQLFRRAPRGVLLFLLKSVRACQARTAPVVSSFYFCPAFMISSHCSRCKPASNLNHLSSKFSICSFTMQIASVDSLTPNDRSGIVRAKTSNWEISNSQLSRFWVCMIMLYKIVMMIAGNSAYLNKISSLSLWHHHCFG